MPVKHARNSSSLSSLFNKNQLDNDQLVYNTLLADSVDLLDSKHGNNDLGIVNHHNSYLNASGSQSSLRMNLEHAKKCLESKSIC